MSENEMYMSLADLAEMNTDEIAVLMSRLPEAGMFMVQCIESTAKESKTEGKPPLFRFGFKSEILVAQPLNKEADPEKFVGKNLTESYTLWPETLSESIGLLKGRYIQVGLSPIGRMGGVEGGAPGWIDTIVGHKFWIRVRRFEANGTERAGFDWLPTEETKELMKQMKEAAA